MTSGIRGERLFPWFGELALVWVRHSQAYSWTTNRPSVFKLGRRLIASVVISFMVAAIVAAEDPVEVATIAAAEDPVEVVILAFVEESAKNPLSADAYSRWSTLLLEVAAANPDSAFYHIAMKHAVSLTNSGGDYARSELTAIQAIQTLKDPYHKALWYMELGEIRRELANQAVASNNQGEAKRLARLAIDAFENLTLEAEKLPESGRPLELSERQLIASSMTAEIASGILGDPSRATIAYRQGLALLESIGTAKGVIGVTSMGYDQEQFAGSLIVSALNAGQKGEALKALDLTRKIPSGRWPPSFYAHNYSSLAYPHGGDEYQSFIKDWLQTQPPDSWTGILHFYSAEDFYRRGDYNSAKLVYELVLSKYSDGLLAADKEAIAEGRGGYLAIVLDHLSRIYQMAGQHEESAKLISEFKELLPNDPGLEIVSGLQSAALKEKEEQQDRPDSHMQKQENPSFWLSAKEWIVLGNVVVIGILVAIGLKRKKGA